MVTARHCLEQPGDAPGPIESVAIQLNTLEGPAAEIEVPLLENGWKTAPPADVAVLPFAPRRDVFDYLYYPIRSAATEQFLEDNFVGPGEDVLVTGLLIYHPGETRIMPIVRVGNISAFPDEPVALETGEDRVTLVEVRSLGGLSGSPAFAHLSELRRDRDGNLVQIASEWSAAGPNYLLGLVHGFYPAAANDPDRVGPPDDSPLNTGISVVVPVDRIVDIIDSPELRELREHMKRALKAKNAPTPAGSVSSDQNLEFERFEALARRVVSIPKKEVDKKPKQSDGGLPHPRSGHNGGE